MATIYNSANDTLVSGTGGNDEIQNVGFSSVYPYWQNGGKNVTIDAGNGDDYVSTANTSKVSIDAGTGNDLVNMDRYSPNNSKKFLIEYASGDGLDTIGGFNSDDTLHISGGTYSTAKSGNGLLVTVEDGSVLLKNVHAITESININGTKIKLEPVVNLSDGEKISVFRDSVSIIGSAGNDTVYNSSTNKVTIAACAGNDSVYNWDGKNLFVDLGAGNDSIQNWNGDNASINGGAGNDLISLDSYAKNNLIQYAAGDGNDSIFGFDENDTLKIFGDSYSTQKSGSNVIVTVGNEKISLVGAASLETVNIDLEENFWTLDGTTATYISGGKSSATVKGVTSTDGLKVDGDTIKLAASALKNKVTVSGDYVFDFAEDYSRATIMGSDADDTIIARGKYISVKGGAGDDTLQLFGTGTLTGGSGSDTFVYDGKGNDVVTDYDEEDTIKFEVAVKKISKSKDNVVFTTDGGKLTLKDVGDKVIAYKDADGVKKYYPVEFSDDGETAKLLKTYGKDSFDISDFEEYKNSVETIDASKVTIDLNIIGNKRANVITGTSEDDYIDGQAGSDTVDGGKGKDTLLGGAGEDSLWGGVGSDTLFGGAGEDVFCYSLGDGKDVIEDYKFGVDTVMILSGEVKAPKLNGTGDVTFKIGSGQITFANSADKSIELVDTSGNVLSTYTPK